MGEDATAPRSGNEVMAAIDSGGEGPRLVIAEIDADGSWVSIRAAAAACLADWR